MMKVYGGVSAALQLQICRQTRARGWDSARAGSGIWVAITRGMLKLVGSYVIAKLLGFGLLGAVLIYALLTMFT